MPTGAYLRASEAAAIGSIVTVRAIDVAPSYATQRSFTNAGDRFLKRVAAGYGDIVCAQNETVTINGKRVALRRSHDDAGRELPSWSGCYTLSRDFVFLLGETPDSFDGRYWGPTPVSQIEGVWRRLGA